jgi:hypothetical protein
MPGVLRSVQTRALRQFLHHARHVDRRQPAVPHLPVSVDRPEYRPGTNAREFQPPLHCANRTRFRIRSVWDADLAAHAVLICLGPTERDRQTVLAERAILKIEGDQL